ncbi:MAG: Ig-like domain-containing protein [Lachnospiraceae bacterium]|nr:Ig-like domain-containing protein [Lachnospiraceae bacterium]
MRLKRFIATAVCGVLFIAGSGVADLNSKAKENDLDISEYASETDAFEDENEVEDEVINEYLDISIDEDGLLGATNSSVNDSNYATITYTKDVSVTSKDAILKKINDIRLEAYKEGIISSYTPIKWSSDLEEIAFQRAAEAAVFLGHTRPDGTSCFTCKAQSGGKSRAEIIASPSDELYAIDLWYSEKDDLVNNTGKETGHYEELLYADYIGIASCGVTVGETAYYQQGTEEQKCKSGTKTVSIKVSSDNLKYFDVSYDGVDSDGTISVSLNSSKKITPVLKAKEGWERSGGSISATGTYTSSDSSIATVDNEGNIKGISDGKVTITFNDGVLTKSFDLYVKNYIEMFRLYNPNSGEHFYTSNVAEKDNLVGVGWRYEGIGWKAPAKSNTPVYRLYNKNAGDHHYTMSEKEKDNLVSLGWKYEGIGWYSDDAKSVPLYRQYNPNAKAGSHNYTTSKAENDKLVSLGWRDEGIGWYGVK